MYSQYPGTAARLVAGALTEKCADVPSFCGTLAMSLTQPNVWTMSSMRSVPRSTIAIVMYVRTFSFGLLTMPRYGNTPSIGNAHRSRKILT